MDTEFINKILSDTAYVKVSGSPQELKCAEYIRSRCREFGFETRFETFNVRMYKDEQTQLLVDGVQIECKAYSNSGNGHIIAPLYILSGTDDISLTGCKGKIVLSAKPVGGKLYDALCENGALAFITFCGNVNHNNRDIDRRRIGFELQGKPHLPCVCIHISDALELAKHNGAVAELSVIQEYYAGTSQNVVLDIPGRSEETVVMTAHYDTTPLSVGAYDNMTGCIALLYMAEYFSNRQTERSLRLVWCGSEETGLIGSQAYCRDHSDELCKTVLNINLDMLGCAMGGFVSFSCIDESSAEFLKQFAAGNGFATDITYGIRSSDQNPFLYNGVPAVSFARYAVADTGLTHTRYDTADCISADVLFEDIKYIARFTEYVLCNTDFPPTREISDKIRSEVEKYMERKEKIL